MKVAKPLFLWVIFFAAISGLAGCATMAGGDNTKNTNPAMLEPQALIKFSDVPVPMGLRSLPNQSYSFESSGVRVGVLKYQGKANADQVINFYKEQMAMYNWNLVNIIEYGQRLMNFDRDNETCIINIEPKGSSVILTISLGPKSQGAVKKAKSPVK